MISIHALRVEGDSHGRSMGVRRWISIHALRVEGDLYLDYILTQISYFYPRPPGGGRRRRKRVIICVHPIFLSTPSGWRATHRGGA